MSELRSTRSDELRSCVRVLRILEEADRRKLYAELGYPSLYQFCLGVLHLSEHEAYLRCRTHNQLSAAHQFGDEYMTLMSQGFRPATRSRPRARSASLPAPEERSDPSSWELGIV